MTQITAPNPKRSERRAIQTVSSPPVVRAAVEPAVARLDLEAGAARAACATPRARARRAHRRLARRAPHGERERRRRSSQSARSKIPGSRSIQRPCVSSTSSVLGAKTSKTKRPPGQQSRVAAARARVEALGVGLQVEERAERAGDERRRAPSTGGSRRSPSRQIEERSATPASAARAAADVEHPARTRRRRSPCTPAARPGWRSGRCRPRARRRGPARRASPPRRRSRCPR